MVLYWRDYPEPFTDHCSPFPPSTNGWNTTVLTNMINNCKTVPVEEPPEQACAALKPSADRSKGDKCHYQNNIPDEEVGYTGAIKYLPGCVSLGIQLFGLMHVHFPC